MKLGTFKALTGTNELSLYCVHLFITISTVGFVSADVLRLVFDVLFDEDVVRKEVFYKWSLAAARQGKDDAIASVSGFFLWLTETEAAGFA